MGGSDVVKKSKVDDFEIEDNDILKSKRGT